MRWHRKMLMVIIAASILVLVSIYGISKNPGRSLQGFFGRIGADLFFYQKSGARSWLAKFRLMNGQEERTIGVAKNQKVKVSFAVRLRAGKLKITVLDPEGKAFRRTSYSAKDNQTAGGVATPLILSQSGKWRVLVVGHQARGQFHIRWDG